MKYKCMIMECDSRKRSDGSDWCMHAKEHSNCDLHNPKWGNGTCMHAAIDLRIPNNGCKRFI